MTTAQYLRMLPIMTQDGPLSVYEMRRFCGHDEQRPAILSPWACHGRLFATDGRCLASTESAEVPADDGVPKEVYEKLTAQVAAWSIWTATPWLRLRIVGPIPAPFETCAECGGNGISEGGTCFECDGCGEAWRDRDVACGLAMGAPLVGLKYLHILHTAFPNAVWEAHGESEAFKHGGWLIRDARAVAVVQPVLCGEGCKIVVVTTEEGDGE